MTAKRGETPETQAKRAIVEALRWRGWRVVNRSSRGRGKVTGATRDPGEFDLEVYPGHGCVVFVEVKRADGEGVTSPAQLAWQAARRAEGYVAEVVETPQQACEAVGKAQWDRSAT